MLPEVGQRLFTAKAIAWGRRLFVAQLLNNAVIRQEYIYYEELETFKYKHNVVICHEKDVGNNLRQ